MTALIFGKARERQRDRLESEDSFDARYGTDTSSLVRSGDLGDTGDNSTHAVLYWPTLTRTADSILSCLNIEHRNFTFIDMGSGKGRVLLMASMLPFRRIIGVEFSASLHAIAQNNVEVFDDEGQKCGTIDLFCQDAAGFSFPDDNIVVFLFDPFDRPVLASVIANLERSLRTSPRDVWIVYLHTRCRDVIDASPFFELVREVPRVGPRYTTVEYDWCIYRSERSA